MKKLIIRLIPFFPLLFIIPIIFVGVAYTVLAFLSVGFVGLFIYQFKFANKTKSILEAISKPPISFVGQTDISPIECLENMQGLILRWSAKSYKGVMQSCLFGLFMIPAFPALIWFIKNKLDSDGKFKLENNNHIEFFTFLSDFIKKLPTEVSLLFIVLFSVALLFLIYYAKTYKLNPTIIVNPSSIKLQKSDKTIEEIRSSEIRDISVLTYEYEDDIRSDIDERTIFIKKYSYIVACDVADKQYNLCITHDENMAKNIKEKILNKIKPFMANDKTI